MPEIVFKGKEYVYNHHLTVPYRPLIADPKEVRKQRAAEGKVMKKGAGDSDAEG